MNARSIRRAAERTAQKHAKKEARQQAMMPESPSAKGADACGESLDESAESRRRASHISDAQLTANRANAKLSTGPRSETGKRISSFNAVKTGLTGRTVLLPSDDAVLYKQHLERFTRDHTPEGERECELVQSLADTQWRLNRIPALEFGIFARGRVQFAEQFTEYDEHTAATLADAETAIVYERQLRNLQLQEKRLWRQYGDVLIELGKLQNHHLFNPQKPAPAKPAKPQILPQNGFEFLNSPKGADARHQSEEEFANHSGGVLDSATVLGEWLKKLEDSGKRINNLPLEEMEKEIDSLDALVSFPGNNIAA